MRIIKKITITAFLIFIILGFTSQEAKSWPRVRFYAGIPNTVVVKPGPKYVWVEGHYKVNKWGKFVWIPGQWKRI